LKKAVPDSQALGKTQKKNPQLFLGGKGAASDERHWGRNLSKKVEDGKVSLSEGRSPPGLKGVLLEKRQCLGRWLKKKAHPSSKNFN